MEHFYFRKGNFALYDIQSWNVPSQLPLGAAALGSSILSFALVIPSMNQVLYTGPIARKTGDIGFETAMVVTALLYVPLRHLEKRWRGVWTNLDFKGDGIELDGSQMNEWRAGLSFLSGLTTDVLM
jgi:hypothetical protein